MKNCRVNTKKLVSEALKTLSNYSVKQEGKTPADKLVEIYFSNNISDADIHTRELLNIVLSLPPKVINKIIEVEDNVLSEAIRRIMRMKIGNNNISVKVNEGNRVVSINNKNVSLKDILNFLRRGYSVNIPFKYINKNIVDNLYLRGYYFVREDDRVFITDGFVDNKRYIFTSTSQLHRVDYWSSNLLHRSGIATNSALRVATISSMDTDELRDLVRKNFDKSVYNHVDSILNSNNIMQKYIDYVSKYGSIIDGDMFVTLLENDGITALSNLNYEQKRYLDAALLLYGHENYAQLNIDKIMVAYMLYSGKFLGEDLVRAKAEIIKGILTGDSNVDEYIDAVLFMKRKDPSISILIEEFGGINELATAIRKGMKKRKGRIYHTWERTKSIIINDKNRDLLLETILDIMLTNPDNLENVKMSYQSYNIDSGIVYETKRNIIDIIRANSNKYREEMLWQKDINTLVSIAKHLGISIKENNEYSNIKDLLNMLKVPRSVLNAIRFTDRDLKEFKNDIIDTINERLIIAVKYALNGDKHDIFTDMMISDVENALKVEIKKEKNGKYSVKANDTFNYTRLEDIDSDLALAMIVMASESVGLNIVNSNILVSRLKNYGSVEEFVMNAFANHPLKIKEALELASKLNIDNLYDSIVSLYETMINNYHKDHIEKVLKLMKNDKMYKKIIDEIYSREDDEDYSTPSLPNVLKFFRTISETTDKALKKLRKMPKETSRKVIDLVKDRIGMNLNDTLDESNIKDKVREFLKTLPSINNLINTFGENILNDEYLEKAIIIAISRLATDTDTKKNKYIPKNYRQIYINPLTLTKSEKIELLVLSILDFNDNVEIIPTMHVSNVDEILDDNNKQALEELRDKVYDILEVTKDIYFTKNNNTHRVIRTLLGLQSIYERVDYSRISSSSSRYLSPSEFSHLVENIFNNSIAAQFTTQGDKISIENIVNEVETIIGDVKRNLLSTKNKLESMKYSNPNSRYKHTINNIIDSEVDRIEGIMKDLDGVIKDNVKEKIMETFKISDLDEAIKNGLEISILSTGTNMSDEFYEGKLTDKVFFKVLFSGIENEEGLELFGLKSTVNINMLYDYIVRYVNKENDVGNNIRKIGVYNKEELIYVLRNSGNPVLLRIADRVEAIQDEAVINKLITSLRNDKADGIIINSEDGRVDRYDKDLTDVITSQYRDNAVKNSNLYTYNEKSKKLVKDANSFRALKKYRDVIMDSSISTSKRLEAIVEFLQLIGIPANYNNIQNILDKEIVIWNDKKYTGRDILFSYDNNVIDIIYNHLKDGYKTLNLSKNEKLKEYNNFVSSLLHNIVVEELSNNIKYESNTKFVGDKKKYIYYKSILIKRAHNRIMNDKKYLDKLERDVFSRHSVFLSMLKDDRLRHLFDVDVFSTNFYKSGNHYKDWEDTTPFETEKAKFYSFYNIENIPNELYDVEDLQEQLRDVEGFTYYIAPPMSDKSTGLMFKMPVYKFNYGDYYFIDSNNRKIDLTDKGVRFLFEKVFKGELERIYNLHNIPDPLKTKADKQYHWGKFLISLHHLNYQIVNGKQFHQYLESTAKSSKSFDEFYESIVNNVEVIEATKEAFNEYSENFLRDFEEKYGDIINNKFLKKFYQGDLSDDILSTHLKIKYMTNYMVAIQNMFQLYAGDVMWYGKKPPTLDNGVIKDKDKFNREIYEKLADNLGKRIPMIRAMGEQGLDWDNEEYIQLAIEDHIDMASNIEKIVEVFVKDKDKQRYILHLIDAYRNNKPVDRDGYKNINVKDNIKNSIGKIMSKNTIDGEDIKKVIRLLLVTPDEKNIISYLDVNGTDAQEYITISEKMRILLSTGQITRDVYDRVMSKIKLGEDYELTKEDLDIVLLPEKPFYGGRVYDEDTKTFAPVMIKSSAVVLLPSLTRGTKLDRLRKAMELIEKKTGKTVRAAPESAMKLYVPRDRYDYMSDDSTLDDSKIDEIIQKHSITIDRNFFLQQQRINYKSEKGKEVVKHASQTFKQVFTGILTIQDNIFEIDGKRVSGEELYEMYKDIYNELIETLSLDLAGRLGDGYNLDPQKVIDTIKENNEWLEDEDAMMSFELQPDGKGGVEFSIPPSGFARKLYESSVTSIASKVIDFEMPGYNMIISAEANTKMAVKGYSSLQQGVYNDIIWVDWKDSERGKGGRYSDDKYVPVLMSMKWRDKDGNLIKLINDDGTINSLYVEERDGKYFIREGMIDKDLLAGLTSVRIPTSSHPSMSAIKIVGFLPPQYEDTMLVPDSIIAQKDNDFDIDKETVYIPHITILDDGRMIMYDQKREMLNNIISTLEDKSTELNNILKRNNLNIVGLDRDEGADIFKELFRDANEREKILSMLAYMMRKGDSIFEDKMLFEKIVAYKQSNSPKTLKLIKMMLKKKGIQFSDDNELKIYIHKLSVVMPVVKVAKQFLDENNTGGKLIDLYVSYYRFNNHSDAIDYIKETYIDKRDKKTLQNQIIKILSSILSTDDDRVNVLKFKPISMQYLFKQVDYIGERASNSQPIGHSIYSPIYHTNKKLTAQTGKKMVGVFANELTGTALINQHNSYAKMKNNTDDIIQLKIPNGFLSKNVSIELAPEWLEGNIHYITKIGKELQAALDNEKEQILGKLNISQNLAFIISALNGMGIEINNDTQISTTYLLLNNKWAKEIEENKEWAKGYIFSGFEKEALEKDKDTIINFVDYVYDKYGNIDIHIVAEFLNRIQDKYHKFDDITSVELERQMKLNIKDTGGIKLTDKKIRAYANEIISYYNQWKKTTNNDEKTFKNFTDELANDIYNMLYHIFQEKNSILRLFSFMSSKGLRGGFPAYMTQLMSLAILKEARYIKNGYKIIGDVIIDNNSVKSGYETFRLIDGRYMHVKATSHIGKIWVEVMRHARNLFDANKKFYYNDAIFERWKKEVISGNISPLFMASKIENILDEADKMSQSIWLKHLIIENNNINIDTDISYSKMNEVINANKSLPSYIIMLKNSNDKMIKNNPIIQNLEIINRKGKLMLKLNKDIYDKYSDNEVKDFIDELYYSPIILPKFNGRNMDTRKLLIEMFINDIINEQAFLPLTITGMTSNNVLKATGYQEISNGYLNIIYDKNININGVLEYIDNIRRISLKGIDNADEYNTIVDLAEKKEVSEVEVSDELKKAGIVKIYLANYKTPKDVKDKILGDRKYKFISSNTIFVGDAKILKNIDNIVEEANRIQARQKVYSYLNELGMPIKTIPPKMSIEIEKMIIDDTINNITLFFDKLVNRISKNEIKC